MESTPTQSLSSSQEEQGSSPQGSSQGGSSQNSQLSDQIEVFKMRRAAPPQELTASQESADINFAPRKKNPKPKPKPKTPEPKQAAPKATRLLTESQEEQEELENAMFSKKKAPKRTQKTIIPKKKKQDKEQEQDEPAAPVTTNTKAIWTLFQLTFTNDLLAEDMRTLMEKEKFRNCVRNCVVDGPHIYLILKKRKHYFIILV